MTRSRNTVFAGLVLSLSMMFTGAEASAGPPGPKAPGLKADVLAALEEPTLEAGQAFLASLGKARGDAVMDYLARPGSVTETIVEVAPPPVSKKATSDPGAITTQALTGCGSRTAQIVGEVLNTVVYRFNSQVLWCYSGGSITSLREHNVYASDLGVFWQYRGATQACATGTTSRLCTANGSFALVSRVVQERYPRVRQVIYGSGAYSQTLSGG